MDVLTAILNACLQAGAILVFMMACTYVVCFMAARGWYAGRRDYETKHGRIDPATITSSSPYKEIIR